MTEDLNKSETLSLKEGELWNDSQWRLQYARKYEIEKEDLGSDAVNQGKMSLFFIIHYLMVAAYQWIMWFVFAEVGRDAYFYAGLALFALATVPFIIYGSVVTVDSKVLPFETHK